MSENGDVRTKMEIEALHKEIQKLRGIVKHMELVVKIDTDKMAVTLHMALRQLEVTLSQLDSLKRNIEIKEFEGMLLYVWETMDAMEDNLKLAAQSVGCQNPENMWRCRAASWGKTPKKPPSWWQGIKQRMKRLRGNK